MFCLKMGSAGILPAVFGVPPNTYILNIFRPNGQKFLSPAQRAGFSSPPSHAAQWVAIPEGNVPRITSLQAANPTPNISRAVGPG